MLVDTQYNSYKKKLICSYVNKQGLIKLKYFDINPKKYVNTHANDPNKHPKFKTWDKKPVKLIDTNRMNRYSIYEYLDHLPENEQNTLFEYNEPKIFFVDIETQIIDGFPDAETAKSPIISLSIVYENKIILMGLKDLDDKALERIKNKTNEYFKDVDDYDYDVKYKKYNSEFEMLYKFFNDLVPKMPLITGWNFLDYDWKYLVNRARKVSEIHNNERIYIDPRISSPTKFLKQVFKTDYEVPMHKMIFDYMQLYDIADTSIKVKESNSLDFVSNKLVGVDKINYNGSLKKLYEEDFEKFMLYNAVDSALVQKIHEKKNYISIIYAISVAAKIRVSDVITFKSQGYKTLASLASLAITEGVLRNRFRNMENIVLFKQDDIGQKRAKGIEGGWVKKPVKGMNRWCVTYDFSSLYPRTQLEFYLAPETFVGVIDPTDEKYCVNEGNRVKIDKEIHVVCINGCVFHKRQSPTLTMLSEIYAERKKNKNKMLEKNEEYNSVLKEIKKLEEELV